ncbi:GNAT family N-acetyltransferase [Nonomuraea typhae]|uniref:GNAT family N-acetyltransferase n=1 Tax=Nonomuraea typhae TaxID=2603600 RepID=UPI0012FC4B47|nr:GNAT family N-acetyltransferase [Nonomuraea typhae]
MSVDIVRAWVRGWAVSRDTQPPVEEFWGLRVDVGLPGHLVRHILPDASPAVLRHLAGTLDTPGTWLKVCAPAEQVTPSLTPAWAVQQPEFMMTAPLRRTRATAPDGYTLAVIQRGQVVTARLLTADGEMAARGQIALTGATGVVDKVETAAAHRRRGLGSVVMTALSTAAAERGATTGVLLATADGKALYTTLGWQQHTVVTPAVVAT